MDNLAINAHYKKSNRSIETQSTVNTNITVMNGIEGTTIETDELPKTKVLPPRSKFMRPRVDENRMNHEGWSQKEMRPSSASAFVVPRVHEDRNEVRPSAPEAMTDMKEIPEYPEFSRLETIARPTTPPLMDDSKMNQFLELLLSIKTELLTTNDAALMMNILDKSNRIILPAESLKQLIKISTDSKDVHLWYIDDITTGCCGMIKKSLIKNIEKIVVDGEDFMIKFNRIYTMFESRKLCLNSVYTGIDI